MNKIRKNSELPIDYRCVQVSSLRLSEIHSQLINHNVVSLNLMGERKQQQSQRSAIQMLQI